MIIIFLFLALIGVIGIVVTAFLRYKARKNAQEKLKRFKNNHPAKEDLDDQLIN